MDTVSKILLVITDCVHFHKLPLCSLTQESASYIGYHTTNKKLSTTF